MFFSFCSWFVVRRLGGDIGLCLQHTRGSHTCSEMVPRATERKSYIMYIAAVERAHRSTALGSVMSKCRTSILVSQGRLVGGPPSAMSLHGPPLCVSLGPRAEEEEEGGGTWNQPGKGSVGIIENERGRRAEENIVIPLIDLSPLPVDIR